MQTIIKNTKTDVILNTYALARAFCRKMKVFIT